MRSGGDLNSDRPYLTQRRNYDGNFRDRRYILDLLQIPPNPSNHDTNWGGKTGKHLPIDKQEHLNIHA